MPYSSCRTVINIMQRQRSTTLPVHIMQNVSSVEEVMMFSSSWMFIVSFIVPVILPYDEMTVYGNCSRTRPPEHLVVWGKPRQPVNCTLYGTERCKDSLPPHLEGTIPATPPTSLSVNGKLIADPNQNSSPQIIIEWETPESDTVRGRIQGFHLEIRIHDMTDNSSKLVCRIFDFSLSLFNLSGTKLIFQKKLVGFVGGSHLLYQLHVSSLPRHSPDVRLTKFFTLQPVQKGTDIPARNWIPFIFYDEIQFTAPATIGARFSLAPPRYGFRQYTVMLVSKNDSLNAVEKCIVSTDSGYFCQDREFDPPSQNKTTFLASFSEIAAGEYVIHIQPVDPYSQDDLRCVCYSAITHGVRQCQPCLDTPSTMFTVGSSATISRPMTTTIVTTIVTTTNTSMITSTTTSMMATTTTPMITTTTMSTSTTRSTPPMTTTTRPMTTTTTMSMMTPTNTPIITTTTTPTMTATTRHMTTTTTTPMITKTTTPIITTTTTPTMTATTRHMTTRTAMSMMTPTNTPIITTTTTPTMTATTRHMTTRTAMSMMTPTTTPIITTTTTPTMTATTRPMTTTTTMSMMTPTTTPIITTTTTPTMTATTRHMTTTTTMSMMTPTTTPIITTTTTPTMIATTRHMTTTTTMSMMTPTTTPIITTTTTPTMTATTRHMTTTTTMSMMTPTTTPIITTTTTPTMTATTRPMTTRTTMSMMTPTTTPIITTTTTPTMTATTRHMTTTTTMPMMTTTTTPKITKFLPLMSSTSTPNMTTTITPPITTTTTPVPNAATQLTALQRTPRLILLQTLIVFAL